MLMCYLAGAKVQLFFELQHFTIFFFENTATISLTAPQKKCFPHKIGSKICRRDKKFYLCVEIYH